MDCKEFEKLIPEFIEGKLDYPTLKKFSEHMEQCEDCKEELSARMAEAKRKIRFHNSFLRFGLVMEILAACVLAGVIIWILV